MLFHVISLLFQICSVNISWINITSWRIMKMLCKFAQSMIFFFGWWCSHSLWQDDPKVTFGTAGSHRLVSQRLGRPRASKSLYSVCWSDFLAECGPQISCSFWNSVEARIGKPRLGSLHILIINYIYWLLAGDFGDPAGKIQYWPCFTLKDSCNHAPAWLQNPW